MELAKYNAQLIFGAVDCQGFFVNGSFSVTELAFKSKRHYEADCFVFKPWIPFNNLAKADKTTALYLASQVHCLPYDGNDQALPQSEVITTVQTWYKQNMIQEQPCLAVMNTYMQDILKKANIPFIACGGGEGSFLPPTRELMAKGRDEFINRRYVTCRNHGRNPRHQVKVCAKEKAIYLEHWLSEMALPLVFGINSEIDSLCESLSQLSFNDSD